MLILNEKKNNIHIKKSHEGLFTKKANAAGKTPSEYASYVKSHKDDFSTETIRQATFADNAQDWKK